MKICSKCNIKKPLNEFYKQAKYSKDNLRSECKKCDYERNLIWGNVEKNFINELHKKMRNKINYTRHKELPDIEKEKMKCFITCDELHELWEIHKKERGYTCHITGVPIICKRKRKETLYDSPGFKNGVSVDRLDPSMGYTKQNTIFISNETNRIKNAVTKNMCENILRIYKERFGIQ